MKIVFLITTFLYSLLASEDVFFPAQGGSEVRGSASVNSVKSLPLTTRSTMLPSSARKIRKITVEYEHEDNSFDELVLNLNNTIDATKPIFISQENILKQEKLTKTKSLEVYKKIATLKGLEFYSLDKELRIISSSKMIRNFLLENPFRIVVDFKKSGSVNNYIKNIPKGIFSKIKVANHANYDRVVVELNKKYKYKYKKISQGYLFTFR